VIFVGLTYNRDRSLNGLLQPSHAKSRLIELLDASEQERGIFVCQVEDCTGIDPEEMKSYGKQVSKFEKHMRRLKGEYSHFVQMPSPAKLQQVAEQQQAKTLDDSGKDTLYSNFHPKPSPGVHLHPRLNTDLGRKISLDLDSSLALPHSRSRNHTSLSRHTSSQGQSSSSFHFEPKSIRGYPSDSEAMVRLRKPKKQAEEFEDMGTKFRVYFENAKVSVYGVDTKKRKAILSFGMSDQLETRKLVLGGD
jgi:hypothetical protein